MNPHRKAVLAAALVFSAISVFAGDGDKPQKLNDQGRVTIIRSFNAELVFARSYFPLGKVGLKIDESGKLSPDPALLRQLVADSGPAAKPGDRVKITNVIFKGNSIIFEINGGPVKKKKWYERVSVEGAGGGVAPLDKSGDPSSLDVNNRGSYIALTFKDYVPQLTTEQIKTMLKPVLDFNATNAAQAYAEAMPPVVQQAIKNHRALVGMDKDMVVYAMGRAPKKIRDKDGDTEYEEWIYGEPPKEVNFVRFVGDRVIRIETMKIDGEKEIRTAKEVDLDAGREAQTVAKKSEEQQEEKKSGPSLMRPGERTVTATPGAQQPAPTRVPGGQTGGPTTTQPGQPTNMPGSDPTGNPPNIPGRPGDISGNPPN